MKSVKTVLTFIGGFAVGILAVTGVYAMEPDMSPESNDDTDCNEEIPEDEDSHEVDEKEA